MLLDYYLNLHHHHPLLSSPSPAKEEEEEVELVTPLSDFDPVKEWLLDLDSPPPPSLIMMSSSLEPPPPSDADVVDVGSPIDAKMEKVTLVEEEEEERNCRLIENNKEEEEEEGVGDGGEDRNGGLTGGGETNDDDSTTVEKVKGDLTGEEKNDSNREEENEKDDEEEDEGSSDESSSSSSSTSRSEEADDDEEDEGEIKGSETEETLFISDDNDEEGGPVQKGPIRSKHELEDLPPVRSVEVSLEPHQQTIPLGVISSIFGSRVIIEGSEKHSALNEGSILWITESRSPLGIVDEIFGPVKSPYYVIRYNSDGEVPTGISVGSAVSFVPEFAESVLNYKDLHKKGYDASGDNDEELSDEEFSDDEKEAEYRKSLRQQKRATHVNHDSGFGKRTSFKSARFQKDKRPPISTPPLAAAVSQQPRSQPHQLPNQVTNIRQRACNFSQGSANPGASVGPSTMMMQAFPPHPQGGAGTGFLDPSQQMNPVWANSFQHQPQPMNMNPLPPQHFGEYANSLQYQIQFSQALNSLAGGMMPYLQQQFAPNLSAPQGNMPWFGGQVNPPLAGQPSPPVGAMGQGGFGQQVSFECRNVNNPQGNLGLHNDRSTPPAAVGQGEMRPPPMHSNRGRSFRGRRPYQRGRHSYGGRGQQRNG